VLLTSYIPVLVIGYAIQLVASCALPLVFSQVGRVCSVSSLSVLIDRKFTHGIVWPEFWASSESAAQASNTEETLEKNPAMLLNSKSMLCFDILNNLMVMLTFGLCSPVLAVAATCVAISKASILILLVKRFVAVVCERGDRTQESGNSMSVMICVLAKVSFPLREVLMRAFWLIAWVSAAFVAMICWDVAGDAVGWARSVWLPAVVLFYPALLWTTDFIANRRSGVAKDDAVLEDVELASMSQFVPVNVNKNPLHV
jgi:hypothetical protein